MSGGDSNRLRPLGFFREFTDSSSNAPSIRDAVGRGPSAEIQRRVTFYLAQATSIVATMGRRADVLDGEDVFLSASLQSDGDWYWRRDLAHYVSKYNISLPAEFIEHATRHLWSAGQLSDADVRECIERLR